MLLRKIWKLSGNTHRQYTQDVMPCYNNTIVIFADIFHIVSCKLEIANRAVSHW